MSSLIHRSYDALDFPNIYTVDVQKYLNELRKGGEAPLDNTDELQTMIDHFPYPFTSFRFPSDGKFYFRKPLEVKTGYVEFNGNGATLYASAESKFFLRRMPETDLHDYLRPYFDVCPNNDHRFTGFVLKGVR